MDAVPVAAAVAVMEEGNPSLVLASTSVEDVKSPIVEEPKLHIDDVLQAPLEGIQSPLEKASIEEAPNFVEADSSFVEPASISKEEDITPRQEEEEEKVEEEEEDPVSSSTPSKAECPKVEESAVEALHVSNFFISLEDRLPAAAMDLIYWRPPLRTGCVFFSLLFLLLAFSVFSAISVVSHVALMLLALTLSYVGFRKVAAAVQKSGEDHPFQAELDLDVEALLRVDDIQGAIQVLMGHLLFIIDLLRSLFLIANVFDSFKFGLLLYALTYVGEAFNLLTIFIIALVLLFTVPKTYEVYGAEIDVLAEKLMAQLQAQWPVVKEQVVDRVMMMKEKALAAIPIGKEKAS